jgi:arsenate reductase-like glutaredoxin family protein
VAEIYVSKGKKVQRFNLVKDKPERSTLLAALLGPSGNLRAPTVRKGKKLLVGFDEAAYAEVLG